MAQKIRLLIIDPQIDFCDGPNPGALAVPGAHEDMRRLAAFIKRLDLKIDNIDVTLDSHHILDIAHPSWWVNAQGQNPSPFTLISAKDVQNGIWIARNPTFRKRSLEYVRKLEEQGKYTLIIWPPHCLIGSCGHAVHLELFEALRAWEDNNFTMVNFITKGSNPFTEHYSAIRAEVPDVLDPSTMLNMDLIDSLRSSDHIVIAGQALSHCVKSTVEDIAENIGEEHICKFVFLRDCTSSVPELPGGPNFPQIGENFIRAMQKRGMRVSTSIEFLR